MLSLRIYSVHLIEKLIYLVVFTLIFALFLDGKPKTIKIDNQIISNNLNIFTPLTTVNRLNLSISITSLR